MQFNTNVKLKITLVKHRWHFKTSWTSELLAECNTYGDYYNRYNCQYTALDILDAILPDIFINGVSAGNIFVRGPGTIPLITWSERRKNRYGAGIYR